MTTYKLTVNLDATLAVQNQNGSFNYFKPSLGAEITTDETDDLTILNKKFEELYAEVIGPNFNSVVKEFLINSKEDEPEGNEKQIESGCGCENESCDCKNESLEIGMKPDAEDTTELDLAKKIYHQGPQSLNDIDLPKEEWE